MKTTKVLVTLLMLLVFGTMVGCSGPFSKSPDFSDSIRKSLDQAGLKNVSVNQDRDKGIVTLGGQEAGENDKAQAEALAKSLAGSQVVADQIAVVPVGGEKAAKAVNSDLDQGIENNLDASLIQNKMHDDVKDEVKSGVVTPTGAVEPDRPPLERIPEMESLLHRRGSSCLPMQVLWIETHSFLPHR
jgi:hyperosmotically inducible periplasmic protein